MTYICLVMLSISSIFIVITNTGVILTSCDLNLTIWFDELQIPFSFPILLSIIRMRFIFSLYIYIYFINNFPFYQQSCQIIFFLFWCSSAQHYSSLELADLFCPCPLFNSSNAWGSCWTSSTLLLCLHHFCQLNVSTSNML